MKILIISQHVYPVQSPRAHRTMELAKELGRRGYEVIVYAVLGKTDYSDYREKYNISIKNIPLYFQIKPYTSDGIVKRTLFDRGMSFFFGKLLEFPNIEFLFRISKVIKNEKNVDLLITIANPHQIHWGAARAKKKYPKIFPKKWIADCGDPFMENGETKYHYSYFSKFERQFCEVCDIITVPIKEAKEAYYLAYRKKIEVIPQGFDFDLFEQPIEVQNEVLKFAYAGNLYSGYREPTIFFDYISTIKKDFEFHFYGTENELVHRYKNQLGDKMIIHAMIQRSQLLNELKKMDFLVNFENINLPKQLPSKLIDYAIIKKPILSINPTKLNIDIIYQFFSKDYTHKYIIKNVENYHIKAVTDKILKL